MKLDEAHECRVWHFQTYSRCDALVQVVLAPFVLLIFAPTLASFVEGAWEGYALDARLAMYAYGIFAIVLLAALAAAVRHFFTANLPLSIAARVVLDNKAETCEISYGIGFIRKRIIFRFDSLAGFSEILVVRRFRFGKQRLAPYFRIRLAFHDRPSIVFGRMLLPCVAISIGNVLHLLECETKERTQNMNEAESAEASLQNDRILQKDDVFRVPGVRGGTIFDSGMPLSRHSKEELLTEAGGILLLMDDNTIRLYRGRPLASEMRRKVMSAERELQRIVDIPS